MIFSTTFNTTHSTAFDTKIKHIFFEFWILCVRLHFGKMNKKIPKLVQKYIRYMNFSMPGIQFLISYNLNWVDHQYISFAHHIALCFSCLSMLLHQDVIILKGVDYPLYHLFELDRRTCMLSDQCLKC